MYNGTAHSIRGITLDQIIIDELMDEYFTDRLIRANTYTSEIYLSPKVDKLTQKDKLSQRGKSIYGPQRKY